MLLLFLAEEAMAVAQHHDAVTLVAIIKYIAFVVLVDVDHRLWIVHVFFLIVSSLHCT